MPGDAKDCEELDEAEKRRYLSVGALLNYVAPDRPELLYPVKECLRTASASAASSSGVQRPSFGVGLEE